MWIQLPLPNGSWTSWTTVPFFTLWPFGSRSTIFDPTINWSERNRGGPWGDGSGGCNRRSTGGNGARNRAPRKPCDNPKPKVICQACFVPGHESVMFWTLARALLATNFIQTVIDKELLAKVVQNYKTGSHLLKHARANRMCAEQLWVYCSDNHTSPESVCWQMDWKGLADSGNDSDRDSDDDCSSYDRVSADSEEWIPRDTLLVQGSTIKPQPQIAPQQGNSHVLITPSIALTIVANNDYIHRKRQGLNKVAAQWKHLVLRRQQQKIARQ